MQTTRLVFLFLAICGLYAIAIAYSNHFNNGFHFDDFHTILNNPAIRSLHNIPSFFKDGKTFSILPSNQSYRPITSVSLAIDYYLAGGYNPFIYHLSTFLVFLSQSVCIFLLLVNILSAKNKTLLYFVSLLATLFYALHPAIAETINYVIARSDVQSTFGVVLALLVYIRLPDYRKYGLYLIPVIVGALAKPTALMFFPILFAYVVLLEQKTSFSNWNALIGSFIRCIPAAVLFVVLYGFIEYMTPSTWVGGGPSRGAYLATQPFVILHYFVTFFVPIGLSADTDWGIIKVSDWRFFVGLGFILGICYFIFSYSRLQRFRVTIFGLCWFLLALVPTSSIFPLAEVLNDHRMFFPFAGLSIALAQELIYLWERYSATIFFRVSAILSSILLLLIFSYITYNRNMIWLNEKSLWQNVSQVSPGNPRGLMNYGLVLMGEGNYDQALHYFDSALEKAPAYATLWINIGVAKSAKRQDTDAEAAFLKAIAYRPDHSSFYFYGRFLFERSRYPEAIENLSRSVSLSPAYLDPRYLLMEIYLRLGKRKELFELIQSTLSVIPGDVTAKRYENMLASMNEVSNVPSKATTGFRSLKNSK